MRYTVDIDDEAFDEIRDVARFIAHERKAPHNAARWLARLWDAIDDLEEMPRRFPVDDIQTTATGRPTHKMNFGDYLVFYQVDDEQSQVRVIGFMHGARGERNPQ